MQRQLVGENKAPEKKELRVSHVLLFFHIFCNDELFCHRKKVYLQSKKKKRISKFFFVFVSLKKCKQIHHKDQY